MLKLLAPLILGLLVGCETIADTPDSGADGAVRGLDAGLCPPACRLGSDGVGCLCVGDYGQDVYCRDIAPAGAWQHSCCGRACK